MLVRAANDDGFVWVQASVRLSDINLPQPDLALLKPHVVGYPSRLPTRKDVLLAIEVADTTLN